MSGLPEHVGRRIDTMSALNGLENGPESEYLVHMVELGAQFEYFSELCWVLQQAGLQIFTRLIASSNPLVQAGAIKMLLRSLRLLCKESVPQEVLSLMPTILGLFKAMLLDVPARNHLAEPLFEALEDASNTNLEEVKDLLQSTFSLPVLEKVDYTKFTPEGREVACNVVLNYFKPAVRASSATPFRSMPIFAKICENPNLTCTTVDDMTDQLYTHLLPDEERENRLVFVSRTHLIRRLTEHVLDVEINCDGSCLPGLTRLVSLVFTTSDAVSVTYLEEGVLDIISLALLGTGDPETKRYAISSVSNLIMDGDVSRTALVEHHLLWPLIELLKSSDVDLREDSRNTLAQYAQHAEPEEIIRALGKEMVTKFRDIFRQGQEVAILHGLAIFDKLIERCLPGGLDVDLREVLSRCGIHICLSNLKNHSHQVIKTLATKISDNLRD